MPGAGRRATSQPLALAAMMLARGVPPDGRRSMARDVTEAITGNADTRTPTGDGPTETAMRDAMPATRLDFAEANQWVFYGMAVALAIGYFCALRHPGGRPADVNAAPGEPGPPAPAAGAPVTGAHGDGS